MLAYDGSGARGDTGGDGGPETQGPDPSGPASKVTVTVTAARRGDRSVAIRLVLAISLAFTVPSAAAAEPMPAGPAAGFASDAVIYLELTRPGLLLDRLIDPRLQEYLEVLPAYRKFRGRPDFIQLRGVAEVIAGRLGTTWERGLRDLTGGGIVAAVEADPGQESRIFVLITPQVPALLERASQVVLELVRQDSAAKKEADPLTLSEYRGVRIYSATPPKPCAYAIVSGRLAISNSGANLKRLIDRTLEPPQGGGSDPASPSRESPAARAGWKPPRDRGGGGAGALAWGFARLDRLRQLEPKRFALKEKGDTGVTLLFGSWYEALRTSPGITASLRWTESEIAARVELSVGAGAEPPAIQGYRPPAGQGSAPPVRPPGTIAALSLWRDWAMIWESRAELFSPEVVQGLAQLDTLAGQFFGGREFGSDVLGAFDTHWRLVVAHQDYAAQKPAPDVRLPAFALIAELESPDGDFAQRLKVAFQSFVGLVNLGAAQQKAPLLELGSEDFQGVSIATTRYLVPPGSHPSGVPPHPRYNFSPSAAQVDKFFILSSSQPLARALVQELKTPAAARDARGGSQANGTLTIEADGIELARLLEQNRKRLVMQAMLKQGETQEQAAERIDLGLAVLRSLVRGQLLVHDDADATRLEVNVQLAPPGERRPRP